MRRSSGALRPAGPRILGALLDAAAQAGCWGGRLHVAAFGGCQLYGWVMKKRRPPRPRKRKAPMGVERKDNVVDLYSSLPRASQGKAGFAPRPRSQPLPRPDGTDEAANRATTNGRRWMIFAGLIILCLLLASVAVLFATHWS